MLEREQENVENNFMERCATKLVKTNQEFEKYHSNLLKEILFTCGDS